MPGKARRRRDRVSDIDRKSDGRVTLERVDCVHPSSMPPSARCRRACGTGKHRTRTGSREKEAGQTSRPTRSTTAAVCCCSTRWPRRRRSIELRPSRETAIVLTCPWHVRDTRSLAERLSAPLFVPPPDGHGWPEPGRGHLFTAGDRLPVGVEAFPERSRTTSCSGSRIAVRSSPATRCRLRPPPRVPGRVGEQGRAARADSRGAARPLLELPVELVLPTHGAPTDRTALERALS